MPEKKSSIQKNKKPTVGSQESGGVKIGNISRFRGNMNIAGRDIINKKINIIYQRALTAAEKSKKERSIEIELLAQGIAKYTSDLRDRREDRSNSSTPYRGLLEYRLSDAGYFFGRDNAKKQVAKMLSRSAYSVLYAESGAGKTSLLQAGIMPAILASGHLPIYLRPYDRNPAELIKRTLLHDSEYTTRLLKESLADFLRRVTSILGTKTTLILILDQFEEFFTRTHDADRKMFVNELSECVNNPSLNVCWLFCLRKEYFSDLNIFRSSVVSDPLENAFQLQPLSRAEAEIAIAKPAQLHKLTFEKGLISQLLDDLGKEKILPTHIQLVGSALVECLQGQQRIFTRADYLDLGKVAGIIKDHLDRVLKEKVPKNRMVVSEQVLQELVTSTQQRVLRTEEELFTMLGNYPADQIRDAIGLLVSNRLLRGEETTEGLAYELAHDILLEQVKLNPEIIKKKQAEELLEQGVKRWTRPEKMLLGPDEVGYIEKVKDKLFYPDIQLKLLIRSEAHYSKPFRYFLDKLNIEVKKEFIHDLCADLESGNDRDKRIARKILIAVRSGVPRNALVKSYAWYLPRYSLILLALIMASYFIFSSLRILLITPEGTGWQPINTLGEQTGETSKKLVLALDPQKPDLIFAANPKGTGIYKSIDGGLHWSPIIEGTFQNKSVKSIAVMDGLVYVITDNQIFFSPDDGETWTEKASPLENSGESFIVVALNLYAQNEVYVASSTGNLFLSENRADQWTKLPTKGMTGNQIRAMAVNNKLRLVATDTGLWMYEWEHLMWKEVSLRECLNIGAKSTDIIAVVISRATYGPDEADFTVSVSNFGLCNSDTKGEYESISYPDQPSENIYSIAIKGDLNAFEAQVYMSTDSGMYCERVWYVNEPEWWYKKINKLLNRNFFPLPCMENAQS